MEFLEAIEQFGPARLLRSSFVAYPLVNALHIASIGGLFTSVLLMDFAMLGVIRSIGLERLAGLLRPVALVAFAFAVTTGLLLFSIQATTYVENPAFLAKLGLIVLAMINFILFSLFSPQDRLADPSPAMRICAVASLLLWSSVLLAGRFIGYL